MKKILFYDILLSYCKLENYTVFLLVNNYEERYGLFMSKEAVLRVKEAEAQAKKMIDDANLEAKRIIDEAQNIANESCAALEMSLSEEYSERVMQVREDTMALVEESLEKAHREADGLERKAKLNMPATVRSISRRIIGECQ